MNVHTSKRLALLCGVALVLLAGCQTPRERTVVMLFDKSGSVGEADRESYVVGLDALLKRLSPPLHLVGALITAESLGGQEVIFEERIAAKSLRTNSRIYESQVAVVRQRIVEAARAHLMGVDTSKSTDILSSMLIAERFFDMDPESDKVLVVFSDMIEQTQRYDFGRAEQLLTAKGIEKILQGLKKAGEMPNLDGVRVYVVGAKDVRSRRFLLIRDFWLRYFKECGAILEKEDYGGPLVLDQITEGGTETEGPR